MKRYARVVLGVVMETVDLQDSDDINTFFTPEVVATFFPCSSQVTQGYTYDGTTFTAPVIPVPNPPLTPDQIYDLTILNSQVLKGVVLAFIGGTLTVGMTPAQAKTAIKAKM